MSGVAIADRKSMNPKTVTDNGFANNQNLFQNWPTVVSPPCSSGGVPQ